MTLKDGMALVPVQLGGRGDTLNFLVDSGADETVICLKSAKKHGVPLESREAVRTVTGMESAYRSGSQSVALGGLTILRKPLLVLDLRAESRALGVRIDGLLGADFFRQYAVRLGFSAKQMEWKKHARPASGSKVLPIRSENGAFFVEVQAADATLRRVRLDSGCRHSLCWAPDGSGSVSRPWRNGSSQAIAMGFGSHVIPDLKSRTYRAPLIPGEDGLLGNGFLSRYDAVWIDAPARRLVLETH